MINRHYGIYVFVFGLMAAGVFVAFGKAPRVGALFLVASGILAITASKSMAMVQNKINDATKKFTWNPWGPATPRLFIIWGVGILILGIAALFGL